MNLFKRATKAIRPYIAPAEGVVAEIHREFNMSSEIALAEAQRIIAGTNLPKTDKASRLAKIGFVGVKDVEDRQMLSSNLAQSIEQSRIILKYKESYPLHKFIFQKDIERICKKYGLVYGGIDLYQGFVPEQNLAEIEAFAPRSEDIAYFRQLRSSNGERFRWERITKTDYSHESHSPHWVNWDYREGENLKICAPLKDMKIDARTVIEEGFLIVEHIPDPVVIYPVKEGGIILTAWGEEASDPLVVNEINN